jgi:hypothetical protein
MSKEPDNYPMPEERQGPHHLCPPVFLNTRSRTYLMFWLVSTLLQDYGDGLDDREWETLSDLRARLGHAVRPVLPCQLESRVELLGKAFPGYEHTYTVSGPVIRWFARLKDDPDAPLVPFRRGMHPASGKAARTGSKGTA